MTKSTNSTIKRKKTTNALTSADIKWLEEYRDYRSWSMKPLTNTLLEQLCKDYVEFALRPTTLKETSFFIARGMNPKLRWDWLKYPQFKEAVEMAKYIIGERRELGLLHKEFEPSSVTSMMPYYDQDWKDMVEWRNKLKADAENNNKANVIVLPELKYKEMQENK